METCSIYDAPSALSHKIIGEVCDIDKSDKSPADACCRCLLLILFLSSVPHLLHLFLSYFSEKFGLKPVPQLVDSWSLVWNYLCYLYRIAWMSLRNEQKIENISFSDLLKCKDQFLDSVGYGFVTLPDRIRKKKLFQHLKINRMSCLLEQVDKDFDTFDTIFNNLDKHCLTQKDMLRFSVYQREEGQPIHDVIKFLGTLGGKIGLPKENIETKIRDVILQSLPKDMLLQLDDGTVLSNGRLIEKVKLMEDLAQRNRMNQQTPPGVLMQQNQETQTPPPTHEPYPQSLRQNTNPLTVVRNSHLEQLIYFITTLKATVSGAGQLWRIVDMYLKSYPILILLIPVFTVFFFVGYYFFVFSR